MQTKIESSSELKLATLNDFHIARSMFLDAFSELEIAVSRLLATANNSNSCSKRPFGHRVDELKDLTPNSRLPKDKCAKISDKAARIYPILQIRSDIVHSRLYVVNMDGVMHSKICNNLTSLIDPTLVRLLNIECFKALTRESKKIANELNQILNPPSSPLQPLQGAVSDL